MPINELVKSLGAAPDDKWIASDTDAGRYQYAADMLGEKMPTLVKGAGYARPGGNKPLQDDDAIFKASMRAENAFLKSMKTGIEDPESVIKSLSPEFAGHFGAFLANSPQNQQMARMVESLSNQISTILGKNVTLTSPLGTGFVPFNLVSPSRLIYPVYSPLRNKIPRTPGQGTSYRAKVISGVSGSQTGPSGGKFLDLAIPELVQSGGTFSNWPLNLPGAGTQDAVDLNISYKFLGLSENLSWLAQFSGQGFEDISALANLLLLQEFMLNEEAMFLEGTSVAYTAPTNPTLTARAANAGETALTGVTTNVFVKVTGVNYFGETTAQASGASVAWSSGQVVDVTLVPETGIVAYNIYVTTGASAGTYFIMASGVGGLNFTLQGALPVSGANPPSSDTTTSTSFRYEGIIPTLSGHSAGSSNPYPSNWQGGYVNQSVGDTLKTSVLNTALQAMWDGTGAGISTYGAFRSSPSELIAEGGDVMRLSNDIVQLGANTNYRLFIDQGEVPGVRLGAAVSEFQNPITRDVVRIVVHPWLTQGTALLMSYTLPMAWSNVSNCWEFSTVQDYLSISWPVIDATFRYSLFTYGAMVSPAPQYSGLISGLQKTDRSGSTGTWS